ncbi:MAG: hypothetical protein U9P49_05825 [Thermodesulfobacteriota bacterium]|nr:hypothetical protein [Thermodesulfobacteriota bacterium]
MKDVELNKKVIGVVYVYREKGKNKIIFVPKDAEKRAISFRSTTALLNHLGGCYNAPLSVRRSVCEYVGNELLKLRREQAHHKVKE